MTIENLEEKFRELFKYVEFDDPSRSGNPLATNIMSGVVRSEPNFFTPNRATGHVEFRFNAEYHLSEIMTIMHDYSVDQNFQISNKILVEFITDFLLGCSKINLETELRMNIQSWLDNIHSMPVYNYIVFLPIRSPIPLEPWTVDNVRIIKLTEDIFNEYFDKDNNTIKSIDELIENNQTDQFMIVQVNAKEIESAKEIGRQYLNRFVYAVKLFYNESTITNLQKSYVPTIEMIHSFDDYHLPSSSNKINTYSESDILNIISLGVEKIENHMHTISTNRHHYFIPPFNFADVMASDEFKTYWKKISNFLFSSHPSSFQQSILDSLYWFGEIDHYRDANPQKFLSYLFGLEKLLLGRYEHDKAMTFGKRLSKILHQNNEFKNSFKFYYKKRNHLVHEKNVVIFDYDVDKLRSALCKILLDMIECSDDYSTLKEYMKCKFNIILKSTKSHN